LDITDPSLQYQWYKDGTILSNSTNSVYSKNQAEVSDEGFYWCTVINDCGNVVSAQVRVDITTGTTDVSDVQSNGFSLSVSSPSPVNEIANVRYYIPNIANVKISLSDIQGSFETELINQIISAGEHFIAINTNQLNISSGTYFLKLESKGVLLVQKVVVIK
jgi:hypothetical protein